MTSWRQEYLDSLNDRHGREKISYDLIDAYTRLADRAAALEAATELARKSSSASTSTAKEGPPPTIVVEGSVQSKSDLAEALRAKGQLQSRLKIAEEELQRLTARTKADARLIKELTVEKTYLMTKVKDRDEELRGKAKLLEEVQDEMVSLNIQLNMSEQRSAKLQKENKDLIDRWMARMGQEADAMNDASKFS